VFAVAVLGAGPRTSASAAPRVRPSAYPTPYGAIVPVGVKIPVLLVTEINSATFDIGDRFEFKTAQDEQLGDIVVPKGTLGHGRVSNLVRADNNHNGSVGLQTDSIDLDDGTPIWVNIDPRVAVHGHYADKHTRFYGVAIGTDYSGNMILDPGSPFTVVTISRRAKPAPLVTPSPGPSPSLAPGAAPSPVAAVASPAATAKLPPAPAKVTPVPYPYTH
jgi:hypothetical protein